ncbi:MAG: beta-glucosidase [Candidatus Izemoplasmatales bacterium]
MSNEAKKILRELTLEEKCSLASGKDFWHLKSIDRLDLPEIMVTDGPHGLRKQKGSGDHIGINTSVKATCFPTASLLASSWDESLLFSMGEALGQECISEEVSVLLGPGANIKRHPLCGRNFEYFSEDPFLSGKMASAWINGVQSQGIGTSLKHFVANNQEAFRLVSDSIIDERTLREIYLKSFEIAIKESQPWTVMCSYNLVNGTYMSENERLLQKVLKEEWNFPGLVVTDWGACNNRMEGIIAGQDLEMPSSNEMNDLLLFKSVKNGTLSEDILDERIERVIDLILKSKETLSKQHYHYDEETHHQIARDIATQGMVLLKNDSGILPLPKSTRVALIGEFAKKPRYQGSGSSLINPNLLSNAYEAFKDVLHDELLYAKGYDSTTDEVDQVLIDEALEVCRQAEVIVIMAGLTETYESEGFDRKHLDLPMNHTALINAITKEFKEVVVVLANGAPVLMPWKNEVRAILEAYLGGEASGEALADIIFGYVNPSGKLAETFPNSLEEIPSNQNFPGIHKQVEYREGLYVGYRAYDTMNIDPLFPFGFGLSYTTFSYDNPMISVKNNLITVSVDISNTGNLTGKEIVQVYVSKKDSLVYRPAKELKGFTKVNLLPAETKTAQILIPALQLGVYNIDQFKVEPGEYLVMIGSSSRDIKFTEKIHIHSKDIVTEVNDQYYKNIDHHFYPSREVFEQIYGKKVSEPLKQKPFHMNSTLDEIKGSIVGNQIHKMVAKEMQTMLGKDLDAGSKKMIEEMVGEMPLRSLIIMSGGILTFRQGEGIIDLLNHHPIRGLIKLIHKNKKNA